jgi:lysophospholipase L1-like esterase
MPRKPLYYDSENGKKEVLGTNGSFQEVPDAPTSALPTEYPATYAAMQASITSDPTTKRDFFVSADETNGGVKTQYTYNGTKLIPKDGKGGKVQLIFIGDSITHGTGTTGTTSGTEGSLSYPSQSITRLNDSTKFTKLVDGYIGQRARWYIDNKLASITAQFDFVNYQHVVCVVFFGANDIASYSVNQIYQDLIELHRGLKAAGARTIVMPVLNRCDANATGNHAANRNQLNRLLKANYKSFADEYCYLDNQPKIFTDLAPENGTYYKVGDIDGFSKVHPSDSGAALLAEEAAQAVGRLFQLSLPYSANSQNPNPSTVLPNLIPIDFPTKTNIQVANEVWSPITPNGTSWGNTGLSRYKIASGQDGYFQMRIETTTHVFGMIGLKTTYVEGGFATFAAGVWLNDTTNSYTVIEGGSSTGKTGSLANKYIRLIRAGSVIKAQTSSDTLLWTDVHTFTGSYSADLFIVVDIRGDGKLNKPHGCNITYVTT